MMQASPLSGPLLGEMHLFLARTSGGRTGSVAVTAELGQAVDVLLLYWEDRSRQWWRWGITTREGYVLWETGHAADISAMREIVPVASAGQDDELRTIVPMNAPGPDKPGPTCCSSSVLPTWSTRSGPSSSK